MLHLFRALFKNSASGMPNYRQGPQYDGSGAGLMVFEPETTLPAYQLYGPMGNSVKAIRVVRNFLPLPQSPQVYAAKLAPYAGLGGLQAGQLISQPLQDNE